MIPTLTDAAPALGRSTELFLFAKAMLLLALGLAATRIARRSPDAVRHLVLASTLATVPVLPLVVAIAPPLGRERAGTRYVTGPSAIQALIKASASGRLPVAKLLVSPGASVNARVWTDGSSNQPGEWRSPLIMARHNKHRDVEAFLLSTEAKE